MQPAVNQTLIRVQPLGLRVIQHSHRIGNRYLHPKQIETTKPLNQLYVHPSEEE